MAKFKSERPEPRATMVALRLTAGQAELLTTLAERLEVGRSELVRMALDYWLENSPEAADATTEKKKRKN